MIRQTPVITVNNYQLGQTLSYQQPTVANIELNIDKAKSWSFRIDDIDAVQSDLDLMNKFAADAGERLKIAIDTDCFDYIATLPQTANKGDVAGAISGNINLGKATAPVSITADNATDLIVDINTVLDK